jgi:hypothetical protein
MFKITQGEDVKLPITLRYESKKRYSLENKTVTAKLKINNVTVTLTGPTAVSVINEIDGIIEINLTDTQSGQLAKGDLPIDIYVDEGTDTKIIRIRNKILVAERIV